jgi:hypothetical protein
VSCGVSQLSKAALLPSCGGQLKRRLYCSYQADNVASTDNYFAPVAMNICIIPSGHISLSHYTQDPGKFQFLASELAETVFCGSKEFHIRP